MVKVNFNGMEFEGTPEELAVLFAEMEKQQVSNQEPVDATEVEAEGVEYNVGDYVKIIADFCGHGFDIGQIVIVTEMDSDGKSVYGAESLDGDDWCIDNEEIVLATEEEIAAAKAEIKANKTEDKWAKIGREVGEFKKGDIVRVTDTSGGHRVGTIGELVPAPEYVGTDVGVLANGIKKSHIGQMELIAPVEARFDR